MAAKRVRLSDLSPDELEELVVQHTNGLFAEVRMATDKVAAEYSPIVLAKRHPILAGSLALTGVVLLLRLLKGGGRRKDEPPPSNAGNGGFFSTLLGGMGGSLGALLPQIGMLLFNRWQASKASEEAGGLPPQV